jgi:hypothetical protein
MGVMRRLPLAIAAASMLAAVALPATAAATEVQIGQTSTALVAPTCPAGTSAADCTILLTQMTGLETASDGTAYPTMIKSDGVLTSMSIGISSAAKTFVASLDKSYGGDPQAALTILRPVGGAGKFRWQVVAQSAPQTLTSFQGLVVQFPLSEAIPVVPGEVVALTTPTWAPVLSIDLSKTTFAYRQPVVATPQTTGAAPTCWQRTLSTALTFGNQSTFGCSYTGTRIEYAASEITTPTPAASIRLAKRIDKTVRKPHIIGR